MARSNLGAGVRQFRTRAPSTTNLTPSGSSVSKLGKAGSTGPSASKTSSSHGVRVQGAERITKSKGSKSS